MRELPRLDASLLRQQPLDSRSVDLPPPSASALPEKAVQFGTGAFLRGFIDFYIDEANRKRLFNGRIVAISSTTSGRGDALNSQDGLFTLVTEGIAQGSPVRELRVVSSLSRSVSADDDWDAVLEIARNPDTELVFSNTTEVGIQLDESDLRSESAPRSFPGKLAAFLLERGRHFSYAPDKGVTVVPCELIERNGAQLREFVQRMAEIWNADTAFHAWLNESVVFYDTLVDCIVSGTPKAEDRNALAQELGFRDDLVTVCEPYRLFALQPSAGSTAPLPFAEAHRSIILTDDISPYRLRKVRILNGTHSIMAPLGLLAGKNTVFETMSDPVLRAFIEGMIFTEIAPTTGAPNAEGFAQEVIGRFSNPYLEHSLIDITLHGTAKLGVRIVPSILAYVDKFGRIPDLLGFGFAAFLLFLRADIHARRRQQKLHVPSDTGGEQVTRAWTTFRPEDPAVFVQSVASMSSIWGADLSAIPGFVIHVEKQLTAIMREGFNPALASIAGSHTASTTTI